MSKRLKFNLSKVYTDDWYEECFNCIYAIKNLLDGRLYIGQTVDLYDRFRKSNPRSHFNGSTYIDNSIRFHGSENFEVIIIKDNLTRSEMDDLEMEYIRRLHTYYGDPYWDSHTPDKKQYNQDPGGNGYEKMEALWSKSLLVREIYGNGDPAYMLHEDDVMLRSLQTRDQLYGDNGAGAMHTPEAVKKSMDTNRKNHNGKLAWNYEGQVDDMIRTQRLNHDGLLAFNTYKSYQTRLIRMIVEITNLLNSNNYDLTPQNYFNINNLCKSSYVIELHIENVCARLYDNPPIIEHPDWNSIWTPIFKWFDDQNNWSSLHNT